MSKDEEDSGGTGKGRRRPLVVADSDHSPQRFLRGMITHDLIQRGLPFDDAYAVARAVRDSLADREEVTTAEIRDVVEERLERMFGGTTPPITVERRASPPSLQVFARGQLQPFSRGLLARSVRAAGFELDRAYRLVTELEGDLRNEGVTELSNDEIALRVGDLLERFEGMHAARRYRLIRHVQRLPRPLVLYVGGASGTGKSTLALELGPLLRIYRINATDTIRQVMRMVFTPAILPALHSSSFEPPDGYEYTGPPGTEDKDATLIANFEEQATRVCVGVRAVVERALAENMSIVVEGVHLHPRMVPFADLSAESVQVMLMLATLNPEVHRPRFLARARLAKRGAERYLQNFASIRTIHDYLLHEAEANDVPLLDTSVGDPPVERGLRLMAGILETQFPALGRAERATPEPLVPTLLLFLDGLADRPVRELGGRTPLHAARTPNLDRLAREGQTGIADPVSPDVVPDTASGSLAIFGQSPLALNRGPVEAVGAGLELSPNDLALRGNFASVDKNGNVIDRRAGRIRENAVALAEALDGLKLGDLPGGEVKVRVRAGTEHRLAIVFHGAGLSSAIQGSDPGAGDATGPPLVPQALDPLDASAVHTANAVAVFERKAHEILRKHPLNRALRKAGRPEANAILTRGAGRAHRLQQLKVGGAPLRLACVSGDRTIAGIATLLGADVVSEPGMTASLDTDLAAKFEAVEKELQRHDIVVLHLKGADIAAHDRRPDLKLAFIERVDEQLGRLLENWSEPLRIAVVSDHTTLSEVGLHTADPVPIAIWGTRIDADDVQTFDEQSVLAGSLQRLPMQTLIGRLFDLSEF